MFLEQPAKRCQGPRVTGSVHWFDVRQCLLVPIVISAFKPIVRSSSSVCNGNYLDTLAESHRGRRRKGTDAAESVLVLARGKEARLQVAPRVTGSPNCGSFWTTSGPLRNRVRSRHGTRRRKRASSAPRNARSTRSSGLTKCGISAGYLTIRRDEVEARVLTRAPGQAAAPGSVEEFCDEFRREMNRLRMEHRAKPVSRRTRRSSASRSGARSDRDGDGWRAAGRSEGTR